MGRLMQFVELDHVPTSVPSVTLGPGRDTVFNEVVVIGSGLQRFHSVAISLSVKDKLLCFKFTDFWDDYIDGYGYHKLLKSCRFENTSYCYGQDTLWIESLYPYLYPGTDCSEWNSTRMELKTLGFVDGDLRLYCNVGNYTKG